jgi:hypothetical protein
MPERRLDTECVAQLPLGTFRPFEHGPRKSGAGPRDGGGQGRLGDDRGALCV